MWPRSMRCSTWFPCGDSTTYQAKGGTGALGPPIIHHLGVQNVRDVDSKPSRDFQRPPISLDGFVFFEYIVQRFTSRIYQVSSCGLSHASTKLIGHVFQPQFAAHSELDQEHFSSNNAGACKLIRCTWKLELDPVPRKHTINKLEEPP